MSIRLPLLAAMIAALITLAAVGTASAHASLVSSTPADGAVLKAAPATITLVFSEELKPEGNLITVTNAAGAQVDAGDTALATSDPQRATLTVSLKSGLGDGLYTVSWKNTSADGHAEEGAFSFTVGAAAAPAPALPATGAGDELPATGLLALAGALAASGTALRRRAAR